MIEKSVLYGIDFYNAKGDMTGSYKGMRYRIIKVDDNLVATTYPEPYSFDNTSDDLKVSKEFEATNDGLEEARNWLNEQYQSKNWK